MTFAKTIGCAMVALAAGFGVVALSGSPDRALELYALILLVAAFVSGSLVATLALQPVPTARFGRRRKRSVERLPTELLDLEQQVRSALRGGELRWQLVASARDIAISRLAREHGIDVAAEPERAHEMVGDGIVWTLLSHREMIDPLGWLQMKDLARLVEELEAI